MINDILCDLHEDTPSPLQSRIQRLRQVIEKELTEKQKQIIIAYYFQDKNIPQIAAERGVNKSSVCRCLHRAEARIRLCLRY